MCGAIYNMVSEVIKLLLSARVKIIPGRNSAVFGWNRKVFTGAPRCKYLSKGYRAPDAYTPIPGEVCFLTKKDLCIPKKLCSQ